MWINLTYLWGTLRSLRMNYIAMVLMLVSISIFSDGLSLLRPDAHAPIGVMADHAHQQGEVMVSYRVMPMEMNTLFNGTRSLDDSDAISYMMRPTDMRMTMHMVGAMWGFSNHVTLMAMLGYSEYDMRMVNQMKTVSAMTSRGLNDLKLGAIFNVYSDDVNRWITNAGLSLPLGSIKEKKADGTHLPHGMQLGSGSYDLMLGTTLQHLQEDYSFGAQLNGTFRLGKNSLNYRLGNRYVASIWAQKMWSQIISTSLRSSWTSVTDMHGQDKTLSAMTIAMSPSYEGLGHDVIDVGVGVNMIVPQWSNMRLAGELAVPVFRRSKHVSLMTDASMIIGVQHMF